MKKKYQPVMLITPNRIECACGALATFIILDEQVIQEKHIPFDYMALCQSCFEVPIEDVQPEHK